MTVSYQYDVACSTSGGFTRLLFKWKGSVYKLVYRELIWFCIAYATVSIVYRCVLSENQKRFFECLVSYCDIFINMIPLPFVLGFYVTFVATRWWSQFEAIPWPDKILHCMCLYMSGSDENSRMIRRTLMRYLNLSLILVLRSISMAVKKRFPTLQHVVEAGFMTKVELELYQTVPSVEFNTYWIPCTWFIGLLKDCKKTNMISDSNGLKLIMEEFNEYRGRCGLLWSYDWVSIPLVYTQVVTLATYSFFIACIVGRQYVEGGSAGLAKNKVDLYVPIFTLLQFFFYMGLLKVAEALINPFGDDDEDFELNWIIDRHTKVSYLVVDSLYNKNPPITKDAHFDETTPILAYTKAAMAYKKKTYRGSVAKVNVPEDQQTLVLPDIPEEMEDEKQHESADSGPKRSGSSFLNLLNPDKTWSTAYGSNKQRGRRHPGNAVPASHATGRLSSASLPDDALPGPRAVLPKASLDPEPRSAPGTLARKNPFYLIHRGPTPAPSNDSLAPSDFSDTGSIGGDVSPDLTSAARRRSSGLMRTPSNASTDAGGDAGGGNGGNDNSGPSFVRSKWRLVRKRFARKKSHSIDVENPAQLLHATPLRESKAMSSPDVQVDIEGPTTDDPGGGSDSDGNKDTGSPKPRGRRKRSGKSRRFLPSPPPSSITPSSRESMLTATGTTSCESVLTTTERAPDSGIPSLGTSVTDLHPDYRHPFYEGRTPEPRVTKSPTPPRQRTSSLASELLLKVTVPPLADNGHGGDKRAATSMPNLRGGTLGRRPSAGNGGTATATTAATIDEELRSHSMSTVAAALTEVPLTSFGDGSSESIHF